MDGIDFSYLAAVSMAGAGARALRRGLPEAWRFRLEADCPQDLGPGWVWLHAVSVGELLLADGVLGWLRDEGHRVHVTTGTVAGMALMGKRLEAWDQGTGRVSGGPFPLDDPRGLEPFLAVPPGAFVALETELWPHLLASLEVRGIPRCIVNGRLTRRSLGRGGAWMCRAASRLDLVAARDEASAGAFRGLGAPHVVLGGNLKADLPVPAPLHSGWKSLREGWAGSKILVVGNTVAGEEALMVELWRQGAAQCPGLKLILAPRQPKRFQEVAQLFQSLHLTFRRASDPWPEDPGAWETCEALLLDTLGELPSAYREGSLALVGGGWCWHGGHNPLEPVRWGVPTLVGPGFENFEDLVAPLREAGRLEVVPLPGLAEAMAAQLAGATLRPGKSGREIELPEVLQGTLARTCRFLKPFLPSPR